MGEGRGGQHEWGRETAVDGDRCAFVPGALPPPFEWSLDLINALSSADQALGLE